MPTTWFTGVCDTLLSRIQTWHARYEQGQIYATRQYLTAVCEDRCASSCHAAHIWPRDSLPSLVPLLLSAALNCNRCVDSELFASTTTGDIYDRRTAQGKTRRS